MIESERVTRRFSIGWSLVVGCVLGAAAGWLLAYLAVLPVFLGLFFFLLLGLVVGAAMFRVGRHAGPVPVKTLRLIGGAVVLMIWSTGLVVEYLGLPQDAARGVISSLPQRLTAEQQAELRARIRGHVLARFAGEGAGPGAAAAVRGLPSYLVWAATDGSIACPRVFDDSMHVVELPQRRVAWLIRVTVSLGLLAFAVLSQFLLLPAAWRTDGAGNAADDCGPEQCSV